MSKNHKNAKGSNHKTQAVSPKTAAPEKVTIVEIPAITEPEMPVQPSLSPKTLVGIMDSELFERLIKPSMVSYSQRQDEEPLRQLVESIVTSIAMCDAYEGCRKIDDICQRYLYYFESVKGSPRKAWESIELNALRDYWRTQVLTMLIRNSSAIFTLLLPNEQPKLPAAAVMEQDDFLNSIQVILNANVDNSIPVDRETCTARDLYDFAHGISFPWPGFNPSSVFSLQHMIPDGMLQTRYEMAIADAEQTKKFKEDMDHAVYQSLFMDLIYAQHHRIYDEICMALEPGDRLPEPHLDQMRVRFDRTYQNAYDSILAGNAIPKPLHRSSRMDVSAMNTFGQFASIITKAAEMNLGLYLFHYVG